MIKISVVVPVYNPGADIDDCIRTLLNQSLPSDEYEVIFVDDGSTDDTPARLDELAAAHANVGVFHIPNSGWPGRPRNVGMDHARGEYVYFVDNDDFLSHEALERMYAVAIRDDADIVIGKVVGRGKKVPPSVFRRNRSGLSMMESTAPLGLLTPHKLFRKSMLVDHDIRFPEGRRRLEDHVFVVHAYFHAKGVSVLADYPCYYWVLRDDRSNASARPWDAAGYYENVREVLDIVEAHTAPGPERERLMVHWYRGKILGRVGGPAFVRRNPEWRQEIFEEVRKITVERYGPQFDKHLSFALRIRSRLLREATQASLEALARTERKLRARPRALSVKRQRDGVTVTVRARLDGRLTVCREGDKVLWEAPARVREALPDGDALDVTNDLDSSRVDLLLRSTDDLSEYLIGGKTTVKLVESKDAEGSLVPVLTATVRVNPQTALGDAPLPAGEWEVLAVVNVLGFADDAPVTGDGGAPLRMTTTEDAKVDVGSSPPGVDVPSSPPRVDVPSSPPRVDGSASRRRAFRTSRRVARRLARSLSSPGAVRRGVSRLRRVRRHEATRDARVAIQGGDRLVTAPVFIMCSVRSGSTLLRVVLDSHSHIRSPHELHLRHLSVHVDGKYPRRSLKAIGLGNKELTYLLWDRIFHREQQRSGKRIVVNKTPNDVHIADRIRECWPDARFLFLLRHPAAIAESRQKARRQDSPERNLEMVLRYCNAVEDARQTYPGLTVRYEDLTRDPVAVTQQICHWLGVPWERAMLDYDRQDHGEFRPGFGDWSEKIRSGEIEPAPPPPAEDEIPEALRPLCEAWGYLSSSR